MAPPMSEEEKRKALDWLEEGASFSEVARTLGRDLKTISKRFRGLSQCSARDGYQTRMMMNMLEAL
jgi:IS30 family transposase